MHFRLIACCIGQWAMQLGPMSVAPRPRAAGTRSLSGVDNLALQRLDPSENQWRVRQTSWTQ